ncbi:MAG: hypothetical protein Q7S01_06140 [bacterium]|nr:hypothetical protein [bacterium]
MAALNGNVHLVAGGAEMIERVLEELARTGINTRGNPDVFIREYLQFAVGDARDLRERASTRAIGKKARAFIIAASAMTSEAQNALLKTLEEPSSDALFFIIVPSPETLLATLRSRAQTLLLHENDKDEKVDARKFLHATKAVRIEMLKELLPKEDEERDVGAIIGFLSSVEKELAKIGATSAREGLDAVYRARKYVADKGSMLKHLLEQVALLVPKV